MMAKRSPTIAVSEWYKALQEATNAALTDGQAGVFSTQELADIWGVGNRGARAQIRRAIADGAMEHVRIPVRQLNDVVRRTDRYRLVEKNRRSSRRT